MPLMLSTTSNSAIPVRVFGFYDSGPVVYVALWPLLNYHA